MRMEGKVAVVTGAAQGIGRAIAERLAAEGAMTLSADIDQPELEKMVTGIRERGGRAEAHVCDVSDPDEVERLMSAAESQGGPHAIVSNAAIQYERTVEDTPPEDWDRVLGINLKGVYLCARAAIPRMRRLGGGSIVNMASVNGFWVEPSLGAYCAAKGGVINLTRAIALENGKDGIRCNCICPGYVDTGMAQRYFEVQADPDKARREAGRMHALGRIGQPEEIAALALFLCSDESSFCTAQPFIADGGLSAGVNALMVGGGGP
jgi:NAD(P)-dependent dehydrogenase (short-subunit alcohol dehydrogenase family)